MSDQIRPKPDGRGKERYKNLRQSRVGTEVRLKAKAGGWGGAANASLCTAGWIDGV